MKLLSLLFTLLATAVIGQEIIGRELQTTTTTSTTSSSSGECATENAFRAGETCAKSYECMSGCCIVSSSTYMMTCAQDSTGRAADGRKYGCHATKTCTTT